MRRRVSSFATTQHSARDTDQPCGAARGFDPCRAASRFRSKRRDRGRRLAHVRLRRRRDRALRLGGRALLVLRRAAIDRSSLEHRPLHPHRLQRRGVRARRDRGGRSRSRRSTARASARCSRASCVAASAHYIVNMRPDLGSSIALSTRPAVPQADRRRTCAATIVPFALMASAALMLVVLWERSPVLSVALVGPLLAIALYQRSTHRALRAMRLALTDPAHRPRQPPPLPRAAAARAVDTPRSRHARSRSAWSTSTTSSGSTTASATRRATVCSRRSRRGCARAARRSASAATSSRCCSPGHDEASRADRGGVDRRADRARSSSSTIGSVTVSAGVATFPAQASSRDELIRLADSALYWAKEHGKNRVRALPARRRRARRAEAARRGARPGGALPRRREPRARRSTRATPTRAATPSASASSRRGWPCGSASTPEQIELTRLAASLHDLGKLAIPEEILRKPGPLPTPSGSCSSAIRRSASGCSRASASTRRRLGAAPPRALGRRAAIRTVSPASRSRSARGSSSSPTPTTR